MIHFKSWSRGHATVVQPLATDLLWLRGFSDYWPDEPSRRFSDELDALADGAPGPLVLELSRVRFLDRDGMALLIILRKRLAGRGNVLALVVSPEVREAFEISRLDRIIPCALRLDAALEAVGIGPGSVVDARQGDGNADRPDDRADAAGSVDPA